MLPRRQVAAQVAIKGHFGSLGPAVSRELRSSPEVFGDLRIIEDLPDQFRAKC